MFLSQSQILDIMARKLPDSYFAGLDLVFTGGEVMYLNRFNFMQAELQRLGVKALVSAAGLTETTNNTAVAIPKDIISLPLLKEEQERINKKLKSIASAIDTHTTEYIGVIGSFSDIFELLEDCGKVYRLAGDFERRCFNQAIFKKIFVHDDLSLDAEYTEPFDMLLNPCVFMLKNEFRKSNGQSAPTTQFTLLDFIGSLKTKVQTATNFFSDGLSMDVIV
jgi:hypothetical protein